MSLINDALKRASQSDKSRRLESRPPAVTHPAPEVRRPLLPALVGVLIVGLMAVAACLIWHFVSARRPPEPAAAAAAPVSIPPEVQPALVAPVTNIEPAAAPIAVVAAPANGPVVPPPPPPFPDLKLQGIFYNPKNPKIIINGQSRGENENIGEVRIVKIEPDRITVEWKGQTKELKLEGP